MKRRFFAALAAALALALMCGAALGEMRTTANVWLRSAPNLKGEQITSYKAGKSLNFLGETSVDERGVTWYKVSDGKNTGWVSSRYTELKGETVRTTAAPKPTAAPTAKPTAKPTATPVTTPVGSGDAGASLPDAGLLFSNLLSSEGDKADPAKPEGDQVVELSAYYGDELVTAANEIGLISYRQVQSEVPYQYYDDALILAGNQYVENIVVYGAGYEVFGVYVGMSANAAMACLNAAGLDYLESDSLKVVTYEHKGGEDAGFVDEKGHDSCINLWINPENVVTEIDWSTYTG